MKKQTLETCVSEAQRFLERANDLKKEIILYEREHPETERFQHVDVDLSKYTAAVRRASLDLTHALASLRQDR